MPRELDGQSVAAYTSTTSVPFAMSYTLVSLPNKMTMRLKHESSRGKAPETRSMSVLVVVVVLVERMVVVVLSLVMLIVVVVVSSAITSFVGAAVVVVVGAAVVVDVGAAVVIVVVVVGAALVVVVVVVTQTTRVSAGSVPGEASPTQASNDGVYLAVQERQADEDQLLIQANLQFFVPYCAAPAKQPEHEPLKPVPDMHETNLPLLKPLNMLKLSRPQSAFFFGKVPLEVPGPMFHMTLKSFSEH